MKILQINSVYPVGSTGKIAKGIREQCIKQANDCRIAYRFRETKEIINDTIIISSWLDCHIHNRLASITGLQGCFSYFKTIRFLSKVKKYNPDIIHLHNIHGSYINHGLLFNYIKKRSIPVVWTLHDCWAFTGGCAHFAYENCTKWLNGCYKCEKYKEKTHACFDSSKAMWKLKRKWFTGVKNLTLITPSQWLFNLTNQSFLSAYQSKIISNGIDLSIFKPTNNTVREKFGIPEEKKILLGVASVWNTRKGLDVFIELAKKLDYNKFQIILVGTNKNIDKILPENILSIHRTHNQKELAELYTAADLFVNPTREEMLGLVNIEANACGTPVVTFRTGGSPECIDKLSGSVVDCDDFEEMEREIIRVCSNNPYRKEDCINRAKKFDMNERYKEYIDLYERIASK